MQTYCNWGTTLSITSYRITHRMVIVAVCLFTLAFCSLPAMPPSALANNAPRAESNRKTYGTGWLDNRQGMRVLHLQGSPFEMGYQHGYLLKDELVQIARTLTDANVEASSISGRIWGYISDLYQKKVVLARVKRGMPAALLEELRGMAAGTGGLVSLDTLLTLQYAFDEMQPHGSAFAAVNGATAQHWVVHANNADILWPAALWDFVTLIVYEPDVGERFASVGWPGMIGVVQGMNAAGLSLVYQTVQTSDNPNTAAMPGPLLTRIALQYATNSDEVLETVRGWPRSTGANVSIAEANGGIMVVEYNDQRVAARKPEGNILAASDFYLSPALLPLTRKGRNESVDNYNRLVDALTAASGRITPQSAVAILRDKADITPFLEGLFHTGIVSMHTITSVVFESTQRLAWIARANYDTPAPYNSYLAFRLDNEWGSGQTAIPDDIPALALDASSGISLSTLRRAYLASIESDYSPARWNPIAELLKQASAIHPSPVVLYWQGVASFRIGQLPEAVQFLTQASQHPQVHPYWLKRSLIAIGQVYAKMGKRATALTAYKRALEVKIPDGPFAAEEETLNAETQAYMADTQIDR